MIVACIIDGFLIKKVMDICMPEAFLRKSTLKIEIRYYFYASFGAALWEYYGIVVKSLPNPARSRNDNTNERESQLIRHLDRRDPKLLEVCIGELREAKPDRPNWYRGAKAHFKDGSTVEIRFPTGHKLVRYLTTGDCDPTLSTDEHRVAIGAWTLTGPLNGEFFLRIADTANQMIRDQKANGTALGHRIRDLIQGCGNEVSTKTADGLAMIVNIFDELVLNPQPTSVPAVMPASIDH